MPKPKVLILGLDSATWHLIAPWIKEGRLPNLAKLVDQGASGPLVSVIPPVTPAAWTTFMTGKNPGKHGIFHFLEPEPGTYNMRYSNASARKSRTIWQIFSESGFTVGAINVPFTYPPEQVNGFQISGMDTPSERSNFIYPNSLREELKEVVGSLTLDLRYLGSMSSDRRRQRALDEIEKIDEQWARVGLYLLERHPTDVLMITFMSIDTVQHHFWHYMDREHFLHDTAGKFGDAVLSAYQRLDGITGEFLSRVSNDTTIFVVSDHGAGPVPDRIVHLNRYLAQLGLLRYRAIQQSGFRKVRQHLVRALYRTVQATLNSDQKKWLSTLLPSLRERLEGAYTSYGSIDWTATKAYCSEVLMSPHSIYINLQGQKPSGIVKPAEYEELCSFITKKLLELKDPRTGKSVIPRIYRRDEVFHGPFAAQAPDLILDWWSEDAFASSPSFPEEGDRPPLRIRDKTRMKVPEWSATHRLEGILIASGPNIRTGVRISSARLTDLAPTLLYLTGTKIPSDMDGQVLSNLFEPKFLERNKVQFETAQDIEQITADVPSPSPGPVNQKAS